jgi:hypothetical protein
MFSLRNNPATTLQVGFLAGLGIELNLTASQNMDTWRVNRTRCYL